MLVAFPASANATVAVAVAEADDAAEEEEAAAFAWSGIAVHYSLVPCSYLYFHVIPELYRTGQ